MACIKKHKPLISNIMKPEYDAIIVGAGPAGLFAAHTLAEKNQRVLIVDEGFDIKKRRCVMIESGSCAKCNPCQIMSGAGGAGTFSSGILNLRPDVGGNLEALTKDSEKAWSIVRKVDDIFLKFGAPKKLYDAKHEAVNRLKIKAASSGIKFIEITQRHMGTESSVNIVGNFVRYLQDKGIEFLMETKVKDLLIEDDRCLGVKTKDSELKAKKTLIAPGRIGASWVNLLVNRHRIKACFAPIDVGVRVEVPAIIMDSVIGISRDPKFHIQTKTYDDFVRTFCTNHQGFVVEENYDGFIGVNGHTMLKTKSENTNFAFLVRVKLTEPVENTTEYGRSIAKLATTIGGGKPIVQRMGDLRRGRRSRPEYIQDNPVQNTLKNVTPGDISMALPHRVVVDIIEGLEKLNDVVPGVASDSTLLYAPEIKFYSMELEVDINMETSIKGLYAAGDGVGLSRGLVNAAATGMLAAEGMLKQ